MGKGKRKVQPKPLSNIKEEEKSGYSSESDQKEKVSKQVNQEIDERPEWLLEMIRE